MKSDPYRIRTAVAPQPMSRDEVKAYFDKLEQNRAVNPRRNSPRIVKR